MMNTASGAAATKGMLNPSIPTKVAQGTTNSTSKTLQQPNASTKPFFSQDLGVDRPSSVDDRSIVLTIKLNKGVNIRGSKGEHVNSFVRVQFADFDFKDSNIVVDTPNPEFNLSVEHSFVVDETLVDIFLNKNITVTLIESLPKEKTAVLGSGEISIAKLLLNNLPKDSDSESPLVSEPQTSLSETVAITYANPKLLSTGNDNSRVVPECTLDVVLSRPLLSPQTLQQSIFMTLTLSDLYPVPEEWNAKDANEKDLNSNLYTYSASITLPREDDGERTVVIADGTLIPCDAPTIDLISHAPQSIPYSEVRKGFLKQDQKNSGSFSSTEDASIAGNEKSGDSKDSKKINWNRQFITWIGPNAIAALRKCSDSKKGILVEFSRTVQSKFTSVVDTAAVKYRGFTFIEPGMLMFPTVGGIRGRFTLESIESGWLNDSNKLELPNTETLLKWKKDPANVYRTLFTSLGLELLLSNPLVDKKKLQALTKSIREYIPDRYIPSELLFEQRSKKAEEDYRIKMKEIVNQLVGEFSKMVDMEASKLPTGNISFAEASPEQRKKMFLFYLNKNGAYFTFKEQLKASIVQVVRERFQKKSPFTSQAELHFFQSEAYVYLVDQMHVTINEMFRPEHAKALDPTENKAGNYNALKDFADRAEGDRLIDIAERYHQERISKYEDILASWFDYACFCMRNGLQGRGEECLKQIISRNNKHVPSLLVYGSICSSQEKFEEARTFLEEAVRLEPNYVLANTLLGLFYEIVGEDVESEKYFNRARQLNKESSDNSSIFIQLGQFAVECHLTDIADRALARELLIQGKNIKPYILLSQLEFQRGNWQAARQRIIDALQIDQQSSFVWAALGHLRYLQGSYSEAKHAYETVLNYIASAPDADVDIPLIYLRLGSIHIRESLKGQPLYKIQTSGSEQVEIDTSSALIAKTFYMKACTAKPSSQSWLGAGRACYILKEYEEAEAAFSEANVLNNRDGEVWAQLALLNLKLARLVEANQCIAQALRRGIKDPEVLATIGQGFIGSQQYAPAAECLRAALEIIPDDELIQALFQKAIDMTSRTYLQSTTKPIASDKSRASSRMEFALV